MLGLDQAIRAVGDRWSLLVLAALLDGERRYGELQAAVPGISSNVLASRLAALEGAGLVRSEPYSERPLRVSYALTDAGRELRTAIEALAAWGERQPEPQRHAARAALALPAATRRWRAPAMAPFADPRSLVRTEHRVPIVTVQQPDGEPDPLRRSAEQPARVRPRWRRTGERL